MGRKRQDERVSEMYQMYNNGYTLEQVAIAFGNSRQSVYGAFFLRGFKLRPKKKLPAIEFNGARYTIDRDGYYRKTNGDRRWLHQDVWESINGPIPDGYDIHHIDHDKTNNAIGNLECLTPKDHAAKHHFLHDIADRCCLACGKKLERKVAGGQLETPAQVARRIYCDVECCNKHRRGKPKHWSSKRQADLG